MNKKEGKIEAEGLLSPKLNWEPCEPFEDQGKNIKSGIYESELKQTKDGIVVKITIRINLDETKETPYGYSVWISKVHENIVCPLKDVEINDYEHKAKISKGPLHMTIPFPDSGYCFDTLEEVMDAIQRIIGAFNFVFSN